MTEKDIWDAQQKLIDDLLIWEVPDESCGKALFYICGVNDMVKQLLDKLKENKE